MSDYADRDTPIPKPDVVAFGAASALPGGQANGHAVEVRFTRIEGRQRHLEDEFVALRQSNERKLDLILGGIRTLTDAFNAHTAEHVSRDKIAAKRAADDETRASKSNEVDLEHTAKIKALETELAEHRTLLSKVASGTGKGVLGVAGSGTLLLVLDRLGHLLTNESVLEAILRLVSK